MDFLVGDVYRVFWREKTGNPGFQRSDQPKIEGNYIEGLLKSERNGCSIIGFGAFIKREFT